MARARQSYTQRNAAFTDRYGMSIPAAERLARDLGLGARSAATAAGRLGRSRQAYDAAPESAREAYRNAHRAKSLARRQNIPVSEAERQHGLAPGAVRGFFPRHVRHDEISASDRAAHYDIPVIEAGTGDVRFVTVRGSRAMSDLARYRWAAETIVRADANDEQVAQAEAILAQTARRRPRIGGVTLETDPDALVALAYQGRADRFFEEFST